MAEPIPWGLKGAVPNDAPIAWGARTILKNGSVDIVPDRHGFSHRGPKVKAFSKNLEAALPAMNDKVKQLHDQGDLDPSAYDEHVLFENEEICIVGNTNASYGYLYLAAWKKS